MTRVVGLLGGVGPGSTAAFYLEVVRRYGQRHGGDEPALLIYSVPLAASIEAAILGGQTNGPQVEQLKGLLEGGVAALARAGADAIAMPCNTLQAWLPAIVARSGLPYLALIGETVRYARRAGYQRVALVCTEAMRLMGLYQAELEAQSVPYLLPGEADQAAITQAILASLHGQPDANAPLLPVLRRLENDADALLLGCSDLHSFTTPLPVVDAMQVLAEATVEYLEL